MSAARSASLRFGTDRNGGGGIDTDVICKNRLARLVIRPRGHAPPPSPPGLGELLLVVVAVVVSCSNDVVHRALDRVTSSA